MLIEHSTFVGVLYFGILKHLPFSLSSFERGAHRRSPAPEAVGDVGARRRRGLVEQPGAANAAPLPEPDARDAQAAAAADTVLPAGAAGAEWRVKLMASGGRTQSSSSPFI